MFDATAPRPADPRVSPPDPPVHDNACAAASPRRQDRSTHAARHEGTTEDHGPFPEGPHGTIEPEGPRTPSSDGPRPRLERGRAGLLSGGASGVCLKA